MPGLSLTAEQASRLWGMYRSICEKVLTELVLDGALYRAPSGAYVAAPPTRERQQRCPPVDPLHVHRGPDASRRWAVWRVGGMKRDLVTLECPR